MPAIVSGAPLPVAPGGQVICVARGESGPPSWGDAPDGVIDRIEVEIAADQLPRTSCDALVALSGAPDRRLHPHELADRVVLRRSTLTRLLDPLEADALLVRERHATDRRGAVVVLTEAGLAVLRRAWLVYARGIDAHFAALVFRRRRVRSRRRSGACPTPRGASRTIPNTPRVAHPVLPRKLCN